MCKSIELLSQMKSLGAELVGQFEYLKKELGKCERIRQDILHKIESIEDLNASASYNYTKALNIISKHRRKIKNELVAIEPYMKALGNYHKTAGATLGNIEIRYQTLSSKTGADYEPRVLNLNDNILTQVKEICGIE